MLLACLIFAAAGLTLARSLARPGGYVTAPALVSALYIGWVGPQYLVLAGEGRPAGGVTMLGLMALACLGALVGGWRLALRRARRLRAPVALPVEPLIPPLAVLTLFAGYMNFMVQSQPRRILSAPCRSGPG